MLAFSLVPESMYVPLSREEEDAENIYTDDFFFLHERGVDFLVIFIFLHLFRKYYFNYTNIVQELAWKSGTLLFLGVQFVIFTGLTLCCTHLSDITLTIATNAFNSLCLYIGRLDWLVFPDQALNVDTLIRLAYMHYVSAFMLAYFGVYHGVDMHYDWKNDEGFLGIKQELQWYDEGVVNEVGQIINMTILIGLLCLYLYPEPDALNYELFMWGDVGMQTDIRFFGVAPHWYFRPYMAWLITCPFHYFGLLGLILFFGSFYFQPNIMARTEFEEYSSVRAFFFSIYFWIGDLSSKIVLLSPIFVTRDFFYQAAYCIFLVCIWYAFSYLPYGRFFNRLGGNDSGLLAFCYIYIYMSTTWLRAPRLYNLAKAYGV